VRDTIPEAVVIFQNIIKFNPANWGGSPNSEYHKEFEQWRLDILNQYAPEANGKLDTHAFEAFLPKWAHKAISDISNHLNLMYPSNTYRIVGLCMDADDEKVYQKLEKLCRVYQGNTWDDAGNDIEIKYLTATHQEYKNNRVSGNPKYQKIFDTYVFPDWFGDQFEAMMAPYYERYYYANENRLRRQVIYKSLIKRDILAPWNGDWNLTEALGLSGMFQFPSRSSETQKVEIMREKLSTLSSKSIIKNTRNDAIQNIID
jgi:hypothetical protein